MKNREMFIKKFKFYICFYGIVCILSLSGVLLAIIFDKIYQKCPNYFSVELGTGILLCLVAVWSSFFFHEITHAFVWKIHKMHIRMFYMFPACLIREEEKIKLYFTVNSIVGFGGFVLPEVPPIKNADELKRIRIIQEKCVLAAPLFSAVWAIVSLLLVVFVTPQVAHEFQSHFFVFFIANILTGIYINVMSLLCVGGAIGDYAAWRMTRRNRTYFLIQLYNDYLVQNREIKRKFREKPGYMYEIALFHLMDIYVRDKKRRLDGESISLLDILIVECIIEKSEKYEKEWKDIIRKVLEEQYIIYERLQIEVYILFFCHLIIYLHMKNEYEKAIEMWEKNKEKIGNTKVTKYSIAQVEALLYGGEKKEILRKEKIVISSLDKVFFHMDNYYDDQLILNKMILERNETNKEYRDTIKLDITENTV